VLSAVVWLAASQVPLVVPLALKGQLASSARKSLLNLKFLVPQLWVEALLQEWGNLLAARLALLLAAHLSIEPCVLVLSQERLEA
jgi:hypothetical protein